MSDLGHQLKEGVKSAARVAAATALGGPAVGAAALVIEGGRAAMTAVAGEEGTKAGNIVGAATDIGSAVESLSDK